MSTESGMVLVPRAEIEKMIYDVDASGFMVRSKLKQLLAAAPASPPTPAVDGWQPIEKRPLNNQWIAYIFEPSGNKFFGKYENDSDSVAGPFGFTSVIPEVSYWMPLKSVIQSLPEPAK